MKSKSSKRKLARVLGTFSLGAIATVEIGDNGVLCHNEAGLTIVLEAAQSGQSVIGMLSDALDVFNVPLMCRVNQTDIQCKVQVERWDGSVLDINTTSADLGQTCLQLSGMHTINSTVVIQLPTLTARKVHCYNIWKLSMLNYYK